MRRANLIGMKFNMLTVLREASSTRKGTTYWECQRECGSKKIYSIDHLTRKKRPVKSCGCIKRLKGPNHKDWKGCGEISGKWWHAHVTKELTVSNNRHRVNVSVTIEEGWKLFQQQGGRCALSGVALAFGSQSYQSTASLDRIDSSKGYVLENVQWVHKHVNFMKRDYEQEYFIDLCHKISAKRSAS